jgi:long-chain acyl-CoA synthetase
VARSESIPPHSPTMRKASATDTKASVRVDPMAGFVPPPVTLQRTAARLGDRLAYFVRGPERWEGTSWRDYGQQVRQAARALIGMGVQRGDAVAILSFNRPEWAVTAFAAMSIGAKPAGIYWTSSVDDVAYVLNHSKAKVLMVENHDRLASVRACADRIPHLRQVVMFKSEPGNGDAPLPQLPWSGFLATSQSVSDEVLDARMAELGPDDIGTLIYTSGTTGPSKAVALSQGNLWWMATTMVKICEANENERLISYLPMAHAAEQMGSMHNQAHAGFELYYASSMESLGDHLKEVKPTVFFGVPRVWEKMQAAIETKLAGATGFKAHMARWALGVGRAWHERDLAGRPVGPWLSWQKALAKRLIYRKVHEALGFQHARILSSGAAPIAPESLRFFTGFDLVVRELYGQSEVSGPSTMNLDGATRMGSVGQVIPGMEIHVAEDGELLVRGPNVFKGYMGQPEATAETMRDDWLLTGDLGRVDADGYVYITGRKKDLIMAASPARAGRRLVHQLVPGQRRAQRQQVQAARLAVAIGLPRPLAWAVWQAVEQGVHRLATVERLVAQQHHVAAGVQRGHRAFGVRCRPRLGAFHAEVVAEDRALKPSRRAGCASASAREKPAGKASTLG